MYLFNYFDEEEVTQFKKKLFERHEAELREQRNKSIYGEAFLDKNELKRKLNQIMSWTAAGQPRYGDLLKSEKEQ
jgi:serine/threonine protein kinase HipA of HipAB toxin-antitoxin module